MIKRSSLFAGALAVLAGAASSAASDYRIVARFHLGGDGSRFDYLRADTVNRRLFIANDQRFIVLDLESGRKVGELGPTARAHGVALAAKHRHGFATSGATSTILMFDLKSLEVLKTIPSTGKNPDGIEYDPDTDRIYAANGASGSLTVIDPASGEVTGTVTIPGGKLEAMGFADDGRSFVNDEENSCVHVFDRTTLTAGENWPAAPGEGGTGLAVDRRHHRVFSACGNNRLVVFDSDSGKVVSAPEIGADPDAAIFDPATQRIFVSNSDGTMTILHEDGPDEYSVLQTVKTGEGAKTACLAEGRIYLGVARFGKPATPDARPPVIPGSFEVIVVGE